MSAATWSVSEKYCILSVKFSSFECIGLRVRCVWKQQEDNMVPSKAVGSICLALLIIGHTNRGMFTAGLLGMGVRNVKSCDPSQ